MGPSTFPLGHDKFEEGSPIVYLLIKFVSHTDNVMCVSERDLFKECIMVL
jgi:hypothetical protein